MKAKCARTIRAEPPAREEKKHPVAAGTPITRAGQKAMTLPDTESALEHYCQLVSSGWHYNLYYYSND